MRGWEADFCATHRMPMTINDRCWGSPPPEGECERVRVWVIVQEVVAADGGNR